MDLASAAAVAAAVACVQAWTQAVTGTCEHSSPALSNKRCLSFTQLATRYQQSNQEPLVAGVSSQWCCAPLHVAVTPRQGWVHCSMHHVNLPNPPAHLTPCKGWHACTLYSMSSILCSSPRNCDSSVCQIRYMPVKHTVLCWLLCMPTSLRLAADV
jgi:hypothetical protein